MDPFIEQYARTLGLQPIGKQVFPAIGELTLARVRAGALKANLPISHIPTPPHDPPTLSLPPRPPALCPSCPHRSVYYNLRKLKMLVSGDIGCYAIGVLPPFEEMDILISMGASIGMAHGARQAGCPDKIVATIGDSTLFHAGLPALASTIYNKGVICTMILDNRTTAMTGGQDNPATGVTLQGEFTHAIDIEATVRAMGVEDVWVVNAMEVKQVEMSIREATAIDDRPTVIIVTGNCVFTPQFRRRPVVAVDMELCNGCGFCLRVGCPATEKADEVDAKSKRHKAQVNPLLCTGCTVCLQVCPRKAIYQTTERES